MTKRLFTRLVSLLLGLFFSVVAFSQTVSFSASPTTVSPNVGDTVRINFVVSNFKNIGTFQFSADWDVSLLKYVGIQQKNIPDATNLQANSPSGKPNCVILIWNSSALSGTTLPDGQSIFQLVFVAQAASANFWLKMGNTCQTVEVVQFDAQGNGTPVKPQFSFLGIPPDANSTPVTVSATNSQTVANGQKVCVDVTTQTFTSILSAKWDMKWDATVLRFDSISVLNKTLGLTASNFTTSSASNGTLNFNYTGANALTLNNNDELYRLCFTAIGNGGASTTVQAVTANSSVIRSASGAQLSVGLTSQSGKVAISGGSSQSSVVTFISNPASGNVGDVVCMNVSVTNFTYIANVNWSMHWDSTKISFVSASLKTAALGTESLTAPATASTPNFVFSIPANTTGTLKILWQDPAAAGVTIPDASVFYEVCFKLLATPGSAITFDGVPLKFSVLDGDVKKVPGATLPATTTVTVNTSVAAINETSTVTNVTCNGGGDGAISLNVSGGTGTYAYSWTGPNSFSSTLKNISTLSAGTYNVTITSGSATKTDVITITQPTVISPTGTVTNSTCGNTPNGSINLVITGGASPYTFAWSSGETTQNISNKAAGNYTVTITDTKKCAVTPTTFTITSPPAIAATPTITNTLCKSSADGTISVAPSGGTSPYTFSWAGTGFTSALQKITVGAGTYSVTITDAKSCAYSTSYTVNEPTAIVVGAISVTNAICNQSTGGATAAVATGGTAPYTYSWSGGNSVTQSGLSLVNVAAGTYALTVQDNNKCTAVQNGVVINNNASTLAVGTPTVKNTNCGGNTGSITIAPTGGSAPLKFAWTGPNGFTATTQNIATLAAGAYSVSITDANNCSINSGAISISSASAASVATQTVKNLTCYGSANGSITTTISGGTPPLVYSWIGPNNFTAATKDIGNLAAGAYTLSVNDAAGCTATLSVTLTQPDAIVATSQSAKNLTCTNAGNGSITTIIAGGTAPYSFAWTGTNNFSASTKDISNLTAGTYTLNVKDVNGCTGTSLVVTLTQPDPTVAATQTVKNLTCSNATNGSITTIITGGTTPYTFAWTGSNNFTASTKDIANLAAGTYTLNVKDANSCSTAPIVVALTQPTAMSISTQSVTTVSCKNSNNGAIVMGSVSGGTAPYLYAWTGPNGFTATTKDIANLFAGAYILVVTDAGGCAAPSVVVNITQPDGITIGAPQVTNVTCKNAGNGAVLETVSGGTAPFTYSWTGPGTFTSSALSLSNLSGGAYTLNVKDAVGCTASGNATVSEPDALKIVSATPSDVTCNGRGDGMILLDSINGGTKAYTYAWSGPGGYSKTQQNISFLLPGTYSVTVTDKNNCTTSASYTLKQPDSISIAVVVKNAVGGCNGSATVTSSGGNCSTYFYAWSGPGVTQTQNQSNNLCPGAGNYSVSVSDCKGCSNSKLLNIGGSVTGINIISTTVAPAGCVGNATGSITLTVTGGGGPPYTYNWYNKLNPAVIISHDSSLTKQAAGTFIVIISDGVQNYPSPEIVIPGASTLLNVTLKSKQNESCSGNDGNIFLEVKDGLPPYTVRWSDGVGGINYTARTGISAGNYSAVVTDDAKCNQPSAQYAIGKDFCALTFVTNIKSATCSNSKDGIISVSIQNGEPGYIIYWTNNASGKKDSVSLAVTQRSIGYDIKNLIAGSYTVTIVDGKGQTRSSIVPVSSPDPIVVTKTISYDPGNCNGSVVIDVKGGTAPYTYSWNTGETSRDLFNLCAGAIKSVSVRDVNNCTLQSTNDTINLNRTPPIIQSANITNSTCSADSGSTKIEIIVAGGAQPYTYIWTNSVGVVKSTNKDLVGVPAGRYHVVVSDGSKPQPQTVSHDYDITVLSDLKLVDVVSTNVNNPNDTTGTINVKVQGGKQPFTFTLSNGASNATGVFTGLGAGTYNVTLVDAQGCTDSRKNVPVNANTCATVVKNTNPAYNGFDLKCFGDLNGSATVKSFAATLTPPYTFSWSSGEGGQTAFRLSAGSQTVKITDSKAQTCVVTVVINSPEKLNLSIANLEAEHGLNAVVTGGITNYTWQWTTNDTSRAIKGQKPGDYSVLVTDRNGCQITGTGTVRSVSLLCLDASKVITPDGDGKNETFQIDRCTYKTVRLEIYNRWGKQVYYADDYNPTPSTGWKGRTGDNDSGTLLPEDIYFYVLIGTDIVGQQQIAKGTVNIIRP